MSEMTLHSLSSNHTKQIEASTTCGCFYCCKIFPPTEIKEWVDSSKTAICPKCGIDAVLPMDAFMAAPLELLERMHKRWFK